MRYNNLCRFFLKRISLNFLWIYSTISWYYIVRVEVFKRIFYYHMLLSYSLLHIEWKYALVLRNVHLTCSNGTYMFSLGALQLKTKVNVVINQYAMLAHSHTHIVVRCTKLNFFMSSSRGICLRSGKEDIKCIFYLFELI